VCTGADRRTSATQVSCATARQPTGTTPCGAERSGDDLPVNDWVHRLRRVPCSPARRPSIFQELEPRVTNGTPALSARHAPWCRPVSTTWRLGSRRGHGASRPCVLGSRGDTPRFDPATYGGGWPGPPRTRRRETGAGRSVSTRPEVVNGGLQERRFEDGIRDGPVRDAETIEVVRAVGVANVQSVNRERMSRA